MSGIGEKWRKWQTSRLIAQSGTFDRRWYLRRYPDVADACIDPLRHYVEFGFSEWRFPNEIFDPAWYTRQFLSKEPSTTNPLVDYLRHGQSRPRAPNPWFDPIRYRETNGVTTKKIDPMMHYLTRGHEHGRDPGISLKLDSLVRRHPDLRGYASPLGLYLHEYQLAGRIGDCTSYYVSGWVSRKYAPNEIPLNVNVNRRNVGRVVPWINRPDVERALGFVARGFIFNFGLRLQHGDVVELQDEFGQTIDGCSRTYEVRALGTSEDLYESRASVAAAFLTGSGIEIGAYTQPTDLPPDREVVFFDRHPGPILRQFYDETCHRPLMEPTFVGDAETLDGVPDGAFAFLIANHVIEHLEDPIRFLKHVTAKLIVGGRAMIAAPDKRFSFDRRRALTSFEHLVEDHERGPEASEAAHFMEYATVVLGFEGQAAMDWIGAFDSGDMPIHYHVWDADSFVAFVEATIERFTLPLKLLHSAAAANEIVVVLEKVAS